MRTIKNPGQKQLFDPFRSVFCELAYKRILRGWQAVFRHVILKLMPVGELAEHFSDRTGAPGNERTKASTCKAPWPVTRTTIPTS